MLLKRPVRDVSTFSRVDRALILLTLPALNDSERQQLSGLVRSLSIVEWEEAREKIDLNDIGPVVWIMLGRADLRGVVPPQLVRHLEARYEEIRRRNEARRLLAGKLFHRFQEIGIEAIVLKGMLFAERIYGEPAYKKMNDLDLLVRFRDIARVKQIFAELELVPLKLLEGGEDEQPDEHRNYHLPSYVSRDGSFVVGTHWSLCSPKRGYAIDIEALWNRSEAARVADQSVLSLSAIDALHHLVMHFHYYKTGLKELGDFAAWIRYWAPFDWQAFAAEVERAGTWSPAFRTLTLVETLYRVGVPADFLQRCRERTDRATRCDTVKQSARCELLLESRSTWAAEIEKAWMQFSFAGRWYDKPRHFLTFWQRLLFPPPATLLRVNFCVAGEKPWWWLWMMNLWRTAREVGRSFGLAIFVLLMLKSTWELLSDLACECVGRPRDRLADLCRELGTDESQLKRMMHSMD
ncbi:MAG TPA: nucleotidyltransferase family protein [Candidatus Ozemobacteraceae bacterium]|nr:nucleotidyltransferase family protein [Candidatus Ozemobacteraceae bacterium]